MVITTSEEGDRRYRTCRCAECGYTAVCFPSNDFYSNVRGKPPELLYCRVCMAKAGTPAPPQQTTTAEAARRTAHPLWSRCPQEGA